MQQRIWMAAIAAAALGAAGAVTAHAGRPVAGNFGGGLTVKGKYLTAGATAQQKKFTFVDTDNNCNTTTTSFSIDYGGPSVTGAFVKKKIVAREAQNLQNEINGLLTKDGTSRPFNLTSAKVKGKANFTAGGTKCKLKWKIKYAGDDGEDAEPVNGTITLKYVASQQV